MELVRRLSEPDVDRNNNEAFCSYLIENTMLYNYKDESMKCLGQWFPNCAPRRPGAPRNIPPVPLITIYLFSDMTVQNMYLLNNFYINCL
jgi:hypothetical protein